ncbi:MAG: class I SAM-dependent methyltransferase, partial [Candidatus Bathyarchaeota archaeon]
MSITRRGYGSHSFLNKYICKNACQRILEIGVADGKNAHSMIMTALQHSSAGEVEYYGIDIFQGGSLEQVKQRLDETGCRYQLFRGDSVEALPRALKVLPKMDLIFIDGGHSFEIVSSDWENAQPLMHEKTAVFFHNYD